jgi:chorismate mutase / prephenate dehydratase
MKHLLVLFILIFAASSFTLGQTPQPKPAPADKAMAQHRKRIDAIDKRIIALLNERAKIALQIGRVRQRANIPPASAQGRQEEVLRNVMAQSVLPLSPAAARRIYERIIAEMVELQRLDSEKAK